MFKKALIASAFALAAASPAHALYTIPSFDWTTPFGTYNNISQISVTGDGATTVLQEVDAGGNVFVGARFSESGLAFSGTYSKSPSGPGAFSTFVFFEFTGLTGTVTQVNADGSFNYKFDQVGQVSVSYGADRSTATSWFDSPVVGLNGSVGNSAGQDGIKGTTEVLSVAVPGAGTFKDENNLPLDWYQNNGGLFFDIVTTNTLTRFDGVGACDFKSNFYCAEYSVESSGYAKLARVPEPETLALMGLGLFALGATRRRKVSSN